MYEIWKNVHWNGYYTSRPNFKKLIRDMASLGYSSSSLFAMNWFNESKSNALIRAYYNTSYEILEAIGVAMHHDTITGTS